MTMTCCSLVYLSIHTMRLYLVVLLHCTAALSIDWRDYSLHGKKTLLTLSTGKTLLLLSHRSHRPRRVLRLNHHRTLDHHGSQGRSLSLPDAISITMSWRKNGMLRPLNLKAPLGIKSFPRAMVSNVWQVNTPQSEPLFCLGVS